VRYGILLALAAFLLACGSESGRSRPEAVLKIKYCAEVGEKVKFDAGGSTDDGTIIKYMFTIDPGQAVPLVNNRDHIYHVFGKPAMAGKNITQYQVRLQVIDDDGFSDETLASLFIVYDMDQCPEPDEPLPVVPDVLDVVDTEWTEPWEIYVEDVPYFDYEPYDIEPQPDVPVIDFAGGCPQIAGTYRLQIFCYGSIHADMDVTLSQQDCSFKDDFGILSGELGEDGSATLESPFADLNMNKCEGVIEDTSNFSLDCTSNCTAVFVLKD